MTRAPDAGFTLIETLVALAVLALSALAVLGAAEAHVRRIAGLEYRAAALWVAENHLAERALGLTPAAAPAAVLGLSFRVDETLLATADPDLTQIDVTVRDAAGGLWATLIGFLAAPVMAAAP